MFPVPGKAAPKFVIAASRAISGQHRHGLSVLVSVTTQAEKEEMAIGMKLETQDTNWMIKWRT